MYPVQGLCPKLELMYPPQHTMHIHQSRNLTKNTTASAAQSNMSTSTNQSNEMVIMSDLMALSIGFGLIIIVNVIIKFTDIHNVVLVS